MNYWLTWCYFLHVENLAPKRSKRSARGNRNRIISEMGRSVRPQGDFFIPSPTANLVGAWKKLLKRENRRGQILACLLFGFFNRTKTSVFSKKKEPRLSCGVPSFSPLSGWNALFVFGWNPKKRLKARLPCRTGKPISPANPSL